MYVKVKLEKGKYKIFEADIVEREYVSPKEIANMAFQGIHTCTIARGIPQKDSECYEDKNWKEIIIIKDEKMSIIHTPYEAYVLGNDGKTIDVL